MNLASLKAEYVHLRETFESLERTMLTDYPNMTAAQFNIYFDTIASLSVDLGRLAFEIREEEQSLFERNKK